MSGPGISAAQAVAQVTPPVLERYECKYTIPAAMVDEIAAFALAYCALDRYSEISSDGYYTINSLYFDTPTFFFLQQRLCKAENRFNMRVRSYGEEARPPDFLEIKQRTGDVTRKYRARHHDDNLEAVLSGAQPGGTAVEDRNRALFVDTASKYGARPVVLLQYRRKALFSVCDDYARVTFDTALRYMPPPGFRPLPDKQSMAPCSLEGRTGGEVILELKCCPKSVPLWMVDLTRRFGLQRRGFSKYSTCVRSLIAPGDGGGALALGAAYPHSWQD
jgi:hypothetical protein